MVHILRRLGWDVETAEEAKLTGKIDDTKWVKYARKKSRIGITFDELKAEQGIKVAKELRKSGGRVISIRGGPEQNPYRAVGKLLFHYPDWCPFLGESNGIAVLSDARTAHSYNYTPVEFPQRLNLTDAEQFTEYLKKRKGRPYHRRKRIPRGQTANQAQLDMQSIPPTASEQPS